MKRCFIFLVPAIVLVGVLILTGCPPAPEGASADNSALQAKIDQAQKLLDETKISTYGNEYVYAQMWVTQAVRDAFDTAINAAVSTLNSSQSAIDAAVDALNIAINKFSNARMSGTKNSDITVNELKALIASAEAAQAIVEISTDGKELSPNDFWVTQEEHDTLENAIAAAKSASDQSGRDTAYNALLAALSVLKNGLKIPGDNLAEKLSWIKSNAMDGITYEIVLDNNDSLNGIVNTNSNSGNILDYDGKLVKIVLKSGSQRTVSLSTNGHLFWVGAGVTLVLDSNIKLQGINNNNTSLVFLHSGVLEMKNGTEITGNNGQYGGGVGAYGGIFIMSGGIIYNNTSSENGGGVDINNGSFTMTDGIISGNTAKGHGGGGVVMNGGSTFIMTGGTISGNTSKDIGGGIVLWGSSLTMSGGTITNNNAPNDRGGGIQVGSGSTFIMEGSAKINNNSSKGSAGVCVQEEWYDSNNKITIPAGIFIMRGDSEISDNIATEYGGGGIGVGGKLTMQGNAKIFSNQASGFAGVEVYGQRYDENKKGIVPGGIFIMEENAKIYENTIVNENGEGGGAGVGVSGDFTMRGNASIYNNTAEHNGGGVYVYDYGKFTMEGNAKIYGNKARERAGVDVGGSWYDKDRSVLIPGGTFIMKGYAEIFGNEATEGRGGVGTGGEFTMEGYAKIYNNIANDHAGGVYVCDYGIFTMQGNAEIFGNSAKETAGVDVGGKWYDEDRQGWAPGGTFIMKGNAQIYENSATEWDIGGVWVGGTFTMEGSAKIRNNTAENNVGGVCVGDYGTFTMSGGTIYSNEAQFGGGVVIWESGTFNLNSPAALNSIYNNTAGYGGDQIYADSGSTFNINGQKQTVPFVQ